MKRRCDFGRYLVRRPVWFVVALLLIIPAPATTQVAISLETLRDMKFGEIAASIDGGGTVVVSPDSDSVTITGELTGFGGTVRRARIRITGEPRAYVIVTLPSSITIRRGTSSNYMTINNFTMDVTNPVRLNNSGKKTINIGAALHVGTDQKSGNYNDENSFTYFVEYL